MIRHLPEQFEGVGEVRGLQFEKVKETPEWYIYKVSSEAEFPGTPPHYEVFRKREVEVCIDFKNRIFSETVTKHTYPKSNDFGAWAWTTHTLGDAEEIINTKNTPPEPETE